MLLEVKVITKAKKIQIEQLGPDLYKIRLTQAPEKNKANKQLVEVLADHFNISKRKVIIKKGIKDSYKTIVIL